MKKEENCKEWNSRVNIKERNSKVNRKEVNSKVNKKEVNSKTCKTIKLDHITKIEGHAKLHIKIADCKVEKCELKIFEGSRYFEGILKGQPYNEIANISSRICGVCSVVHTIAAIKAVENALGIKPSKQTILLREMLNIGGIIQSHALHLYFLALPDYLGFCNAIDMASKRKDDIMRALLLKRLGNEIVKVIGGRDIHPIAAVIGGFSRIPGQEKMDNLLSMLKIALPEAKKTAELFCSLEYPDFENKTEYFALKADKSFFAGDKDIGCSGQYCIPIEDYEKHFNEHFREGSTSEFVIKEGKSYMVGALARILIHSDKLSTEMHSCVERIKKNRHSPFMNNLAQAVEVYEGIKRCIEILELTRFKPENVHERPKNITMISDHNIGVGASEAPRGILFHKYEFDEKGCCTHANITTPTSQNLPAIEDSIRKIIPSILDKNEEEIRLIIEQLIRAFDPCISCSTHFLEFKLER